MPFPARFRHVEPGEDIFGHLGAEQVMQYFRLADIGYGYYLDVVALGGEVINLATGLAETHDPHPDGPVL